MAGTLEKKLNQKMPPYRILRACNPHLAHRALEVDPSISLLLPCNVVVRQDMSGSVYVDFMDPNGISELTDEPKIGLIAKEARERLERVIKSLV